MFSPSNARWPCYGTTPLPSAVSRSDNVSLSTRSTADGLVSTSSTRGGGETGTVSTPRLYPITRGGPGRLWTMAAPEGGDRLREQLAALSRDGVTTLVSLLDEGEAAALGLAAEGLAAERAGVRFLQLPTSDFGVPERGAALAVARELRDALMAGRGVAIHCRAGIGRSSLLAAVVLRLEGVRPAEAWATIGRARGVRVPETQAQRDFLDDLDTAR